MVDRIYKHLTANVDMKKKDIVVGNFLGGLAWGLGSVLGATVVVAILLGLLRTVNFVPFVGGFISGVMQQVEQNRPVAPVRER